MRKEARMRSGGFVPQVSLVSTATLAAVQLLSAESRPTLAWSRLPDLPEKAGLGGCFAGVTGSALLIAGGCNFPDKKIWEGGKKSWHDTVYVLTEPNGEWQRAGKLPRPLAYGVSVTTKLGLVCIGGADAERHYAEVFALSWSVRGLKTTALPPVPLPLAYATGAGFANSILVAGGAIKPGAPTLSTGFFALDLSQKKPAWKELEPCPGKPRQLAVSCALDGAFYLAGGVSLESTGGKTERVYLRGAWRYRPGQSWQRLADLPHACSAGATPAPTGGSTFYVIGGDDGSLAGFQPMEKHPGFSRRIMAYDAISNTWRNCGEAPFPNATVQIAFWQNRFVFAGGEPRPGIRSSEVWALDFSEGR